MTDPEVVVESEIPPTLKRLIRCVARGFYSVEHSVIIDILVHHPCVKEDDMADILKFDKKQLRQFINTLKNDKFLKSRMRVETDTEGRTTRHNYHFINYSTFVNVIKYKLDHMRRKIEMEERDSTNRASFKCNECEKTFTDLEADQLFDPFSGTFQCTFCQNEVEEEASSTQAADSRNLMVKFNEQLQPIFNLLKEVEDIRLAPELLEPEPTDLKAVRSSGTKTRTPGSHSTWSGDATKGKDFFGYKENQVTVSMGGDNANTTQTTKPTKERPIWMVESTVEGASSEPFTQTSAAGKSKVTADITDSKMADTSDDIMRTLLAHEKTTAVAPSAVSVAPKAEDSGQDTDTSESGDEMMKITKAAEGTTASRVEEIGSDEEMEDVEPTITVGGETVNLHEVTDDMVARMTPAEKENYIKLGQEMYDLYD